MRKKKQRPSFNKVSTRKARQAVGSLLKSLRGDVTQAEIAETLGIPQSAVSKLERGNYTLPLDGLFDVADAYRVPLISFINKLGKALGK